MNWFWMLLTTAWLICVCGSDVVGVRIARKRIVDDDRVAEQAFPFSGLIVPVSSSEKVAAAKGVLLPNQAVPAGWILVACRPS